jgi:hypothetical protein
MRDKLDEQLLTEFKKLGIELSDEDLQVVRSNYEASLVLQCIFELMPDDWRSEFEVGDKVELVRPFFGIPVGVTGEVKEIETGFNADGSWKEEWDLSSDFFKGRVFTVEFDCTHIPLDPQEYEAVKKLCDSAGITDIPTHKGRVQTCVAPQDIQKVQP